MDKDQLRDKITKIIVDAVTENKHGYESPFKYADKIIELLNCNHKSGYWCYACGIPLESHYAVLDHHRNCH